MLEFIRTLYNTFVASHLREHELSEDAHNELEQERDRRYEQRFAAQQDAVRAALDSTEKAIAAAFKASQEAIDKAERAIMKQADITFVTIKELQATMASVMPRVEAEARFSAQARDLAEARDRLKTLEAAKAGKTEMLPWVLAAVAVAGFLFTILSR